MSWKDLNDQATKIRNYLSNHPCLDYSAKVLMQETMLLLEKEGEAQYDSMMEAKEERD